MVFLHLVQYHWRWQALLLQPVQAFDFVGKLGVFDQGLGFQEQVWAVVPAQSKHVSPGLADGLLFDEREGELFTPLFWNVHGAVPVLA
jgi:hypothetical protein